MQQSVQQQMLTLQHSLVVPQQEQLLPLLQVQLLLLVMPARSATEPALLIFHHMDHSQAPSGSGRVATVL